MYKAEQVQLENHKLKQENVTLKNKVRRLQDYIDKTFDYVSILFDFSKDRRKQLVNSFIDKINFKER